jgi:hypothetical protein
MESNAFDKVLQDKVSQMLLRLPVVFDWYNYKGETYFVSVNREATEKAGKPMMDLHYCATKALNGIVEKTVRFDKKKFSPINQPSK